MKIKVERGDITAFEVDVIVNAANEMMLGGGGVDGAIHEVAGDELFEACLQFPEVRDRVRCPAGKVRVTPGFNLPARFVIHTVGPVWKGGNRNEHELLADCYRNSIELAVCIGAKTIAFPAISCGAFGFPIDEAARIAIATIRKAIVRKPIVQVILVAFDEDGFVVLNDALKTARDGAPP
jgi:O-acetyl-ADP-ribose deacetylase (regulator of RNase III)